MTRRVHLIFARCPPGGSPQVIPPPNQPPRTSATPPSKGGESFINSFLKDLKENKYDPKGSFNLCKVPSRGITAGNPSSKSTTPDFGHPSFKRRGEFHK